MSDRTQLADRILSRRAAAAEDEPDAADDHGSFGLLRGAKERALMLDVRLKDGNREAFAYALLERVSFDPSAGLTLRFLGAMVTLSGRNLARPGGTTVSLLEGIHRHRVVWVAEVDELRGAVHAADIPVVTRIEIATARER